MMFETPVNMGFAAPQQPQYNPFQQEAQPLPGQFQQQQQQQQPQQTQQQPYQQPQYQQNSQTLVPVDTSNPFDTYQAPAAPPAPTGRITNYTAPPQTTVQEENNDADFWNCMGESLMEAVQAPFQPPEPAPEITVPIGPYEDELKPEVDDNTTITTTTTLTNGTNPTLTARSSTNDQLDENGLPQAGEYYTARIGESAKIGALFRTACELTESLFLKASTTHPRLVDILGDRPVVAHTSRKSAAYNAGIHPGHVLVKVNDVVVKNPGDAADLLKNSKRPMVLTCYFLKDVEIVSSENGHMVKYDSRKMDAPETTMDWKGKYVVVGGVIAKPWMMNMYRDKFEYDRAVFEVHAGRPVSVKVKQFDLRNARILRDEHKPRSIKYRLESLPWHYIVVLPRQGYPIKISHPELESLKPIHMAIRRVLDNPEYTYYNTGGMGSKYGLGTQQSSSNSGYGCDFTGASSGW